MNKDQLKGRLKKAEGQVQQKTGRLIGSQEQQAKGLEKQIEGSAQVVIGDVKKIVKNGARR